MFKSAMLIAAGLAAGLTISASAKNPNGQQNAEQVQTVRDFPDLQAGLMKTPGCLGVQTFSANGGKQFVISAWFKNRKAMEAWYYGEMHQGAMKKFFPSMGGRKPFASFKDENAPMLVIASVTPSDKQGVHGTNLAISQIAIEGYTPVPGGVAFGGTFSPSDLDVPEMVRLAGK